MDDLTSVCRSCGLCCDGALFGRVSLQREEVDRARRKHLRVIESGKAFEQPCSALTGDRTCSIYDERPMACRSFACRLYDRHRREGGPLEPRLAAVRRVRELLAVVEGSRLEPTPAWVELRRRLEEDFARA